jgi:beta-lactamase regulating signal transducer with metallopeptidase domain
MEEGHMGLGTSLFLIAVGAVLRWAVSATTSGINLHTVGLIVLIVGLVGFVISLFWMLTWNDRGGADRSGPKPGHGDGYPQPPTQV